MTLIESARFFISSWKAIIAHITTTYNMPKLEQNRGVHSPIFCVPKRAARTLIS